LPYTSPRAAQKIILTKSVTNITLADQRNFGGTVFIIEQLINNPLSGFFIQCGWIAGGGNGEYQPKPLYRYYKAAARPALALM
jgi:hypothetical protein